MVALLALLEDRVSFVLIHPRWTRAERDRAMTLAGACLSVESGGAIEPTRAAGRDGCRKLPKGSAIVFTSGTRGAPRGVVLSRSALLASARSHTGVLGWRADDRWLLSLPTAHVGGLMIVVRCLHARRTVVMGGRAADGSFDPAKTLEVVERDRVTLLSVVPTMLQRLLRAQRRAPASPRAVLVGGAGAPAALMGRARESGWPVLATYGLTEACSQVATERPEGLEALRAGVGPVVPGMELLIGGAEADPAVADGAAASGRPGSIRIRGPVLFDGYLGESAGDPLERPFDADGWFDTGDLGTLDPRGRLRVVGRRADRIVTGGENVDPAEVEAAILEWPGAAACCVVGIEDEEWGERVGAVVAPAAGFEALGGLRALERHLGERLAGFKRPRSWSVRERLPVARSGKVDRDACRGILEKPAAAARGAAP